MCPSCLLSLLPICRAALRFVGWQPRWVPRLQPSVACQAGHAALPQNFALVADGCRRYARRPLSAPCYMLYLTTPVIWHAGLGDIMLTCYGSLSRNRSVGVRLGQGEKLPDILASSSQVAEGVATAGVCGVLCLPDAQPQARALPLMPSRMPFNSHPSGHLSFLDCCSCCGQPGPQVQGPASGADGCGAGEVLCRCAGWGRSSPREAVYGCPLC